MSSINQEIDALAAQWAAKRDLGVLSDQEQAEFEAWLALDVRHLGAYGRAEAVLCRLDRVNGSSVEASPTEGADRVTWSRRRVVLIGTAAASLAVATDVALNLGRGSEEESFTTEIGQMREIVLADGSVVSLNTDSKIAVRFAKDSRNIRLLRGEALFDVAKNKHRPFIVSAGDTKVRAVGTSFTVSMLPERPIQVLVKEGVVELQRPGGASVRATANIRALAPTNAPIVTVALPEDKVARDLAWQHGDIALDNQTLEDASEEFSRYSEVRIVVDPAVANRTITGLFASNDPVGFAKAASEVLKLHCETKGSEVRIFEN